MTGEVPLQPFRDAFMRSQMSVSELARLLGVDGSRARQLMGLKPAYKYKTIQGERRRYTYPLEAVSYDLGVRLCRALNLDPIDCGV